MDRRVDEAMLEVAKLNDRLQEANEVIREKLKENEILTKALEHACERICVAGDPDYFEKTKEKQKVTVLNLVSLYRQLAQKGEYNARHSG